MANSAHKLVLIITAALWAGAATAQDGPFYEPSDDVYSLPLPAPASRVATPQPAADGVPAPDALAPFHDPDHDGFDTFMPEMAHMPGIAPIESTGTWLRRGFWYAEADAVIWNRVWNRDDKLFAAQDPQVNNPQFFSRLNPVPILNTNRLMFLESAHPGQDGSVRATLGHFFFRDSRNRDHTAEFTVLGGGDWQQDRVITSTVDFGLQVPFYIDGFNPGFDNSSRQTISYASDFKSFEFNYRVKQRLGHDQLVMDANGNWHRAANSGWEREYLSGLRFMNLGESLDWRAEDIRQGTSNDLGNDGRYQIETDNDMIGFQMGLGFTYQAPRWSIGTNCKGGVYLNDATGQSMLTFTADDEDNFNNLLKEDQLSFVGEFKLQSRFHITPNTSLRAAYELMFINAVAMAPYQATFIPETGFLNTTGDPFYHGVSFGFEGYW